MLASGEAFQELEGELPQHRAATRDLGEHGLKGIGRPTRLHELLPGERTIQEQYAKLCRGVEEMEQIISRYDEELAAGTGGGDESR